MRKSEEAAYRELVTTRLDAWRRTAYLICRDWHRADDLVGQTIEKLYLRWRKLSEVRDIDAYVRGMLGRAWLDELRRPHRRELTVSQVRDIDATVEEDASDEVAARLGLSELLDRLAPRKRVILILRFYCDLSVEETADLLGITEGTVKSQTAKGLQTLRELATADFHEVGAEK
ncbi:RNA polymerase sigma24 factor [Rhizocola hellebori]|uniref:RNA polymerase sigma24 factor n=1 Tax=Rhizocola hellebori TaxID=1392758 RepID=A0A8J3QGP5_9ACTN|nr:sigma-70 family RNA polymerase sigma factor [Rhizocola hellebori]GIH09737.1 RNA polymerase sigma24 factor [Rhizocola hellebori]